MRASPFPRILISLSLALGLPLGASAGTHNVVARNFSFTPRDLTVAVGDTVRFSNAGGSHTVTGDPPEPFCGSGFFTTCSVTFNTAGTFAYRCIPHAGVGMTGIV